MASIHPFRALRPAPASARGGLVGPLRRREHRRGTAARSRQPAQFSSRHASEIDLPPGTDPYSPRGLRARAGELRRPCARRPARRRGCAVALPLPPADGRPRADRHRRLLLGRRVRDRRDQEARAHAARQGRRSHPAHRRAARADRRRVPDLSAPRPASTPSQREVTAGDAAVRLHRRGRRAAHDLARRPDQARPRWSRRSRRSPRSTSPTAIIAPPAPRARAASSATGPAVRPAERADTFIAVAFPDDQMQVLPYNRTVKDLAGRSPQQFLDALRRVVPVSAGGAGTVAKGRRVDVPRRALVCARFQRPRTGGRFARQLARRRAAAASGARAAAEHRRRPQRQADRLRRRRARHDGARAGGRFRAGGGRVLDVPGHASTT